MDRTPSPGELCHERLGDRFAQALSNYDTQRRVEVLIDDFLGPEGLTGRSAVDVGCGLGFFSARLAQLGADVLAVDIGPGLVERAKQRAGCRGQVADVLQLSRQLAQRFDVVVSSECVEHTPDPERAVRELARVVAPGGVLSLSTPNLLWSPVVKLATRLRLRPFDGHENFSTWGRLRRVLESEGLVVEREHGLHLFPFQLPLHRLSRWCDRRLQALRPLMINLCLRARRPA
ncbi:MAG: methyltransferase domain-containing protein [Planctomycetes bacterium]|nr:methyltransferase domain-containing protein [Planctomycetota bacterium]